MKSSFFDFCKQLGPEMSDDVRADVESKLMIRSYKKGENLLSIGELCTKAFFIAKGLLKNGYWKGDREYIVRFCEENTICTDLESIYNQAPSKSFITAIENSEIVYILYRDFEELMRKHHSLEKMARIYHEKTLARTFAWNQEILGCDAKEIYLKLTQEKPALANRVSLGDLSSYLGISQVSLSRIRASIAHSNKSK